MARATTSTAPGADAFAGADGIAGSHARADVDAAVRRGDAAWSRRAEGEQQGRPRPEPIQAAIAAYEQALEADPDRPSTRWKLLRALHFAGDFATRDERTQRTRLERAREVAELGIERLAESVGSQEPLHELEQDVLRARLEAADVEIHEVARLYFWSAISWGAWARSVGLLGAVRKGVANRLHHYAGVTLALEPRYEDGGAYRLLGSLHGSLPRLPFVSSWVDRELSIPLIERALALAPEHPGNRLLLSLTLLDLEPSRRDEAMTMLREVESLEPRSDSRIEDLALRDEARRRLAELGAGPVAGRG